MSNTALGLRSPDVETNAYSVEVKCRKRLPDWLVNAMIQAQRNAAPGKLPLVVLHQSSQRHERDLVVLRLGDFIEWFGPLNEPAPKI